MTTATRTVKKAASASVMYSVYDFADEVGLILTADQGRVISNVLILVSADLELPVGEKDRRTAKNNPDYERLSVERRRLSAEVLMHMPALKKRINQSYKVKGFDRQTKYYFTQMCIILNII